MLQEHNERTGVLSQNGSDLLSALFSLVQRLEEVESKVRVLQLVSVTIEALGDAAGPLLGSVAAALPLVSVPQALIVNARAISGNPHILYPKQMEGMVPVLQLIFVSSGHTILPQALR